MNTDTNTNALQALSSPATDLDATIRELRDRAEITDALHRFGLGQDLKDKDLFASSFAPDAELDFRPAAAKWGARPPLMAGRDTIVTTILGLFEGRVDTTHQVTNTRITVDGDTARLTALVEAQHLLTADPSERGAAGSASSRAVVGDGRAYALLKNPYTVELVRDTDGDYDRWLIRHMRIDNTWFTGDPTAIFG
ncbi:nuclear transport factor 2 family protein [Streptomyces sp. T-3]|nr:nuclear transport factor 2 family protein [Streptomyces sp. T-3]